MVSCRPLAVGRPFLVLQAVLWAVTVFALAFHEYHLSTSSHCDHECVALLSQHTLTLCVIIAAGLGAFSIFLGTNEVGDEFSALHAARSHVRSTIKSSLALQLSVSFVLWLLLYTGLSPYSLALLLSTHCVRLGILTETLLSLFVLPMMSASTSPSQPDVKGINTVPVTFLNPLFLVPTMLGLAALLTALFGVSVGGAWLAFCLLLLPLARVVVQGKVIKAAMSLQLSSSQRCWSWNFAERSRCCSLKYRVHSIEAKHKAVFQQHSISTGKTFQASMSILGCSVLGVGLSFLVLGVQHSVLRFASDDTLSWFEEAHTRTWPLIVYCQGQIASSMFLIALGIVLDTGFFRAMMLEVVQQRSTSTALLRWLSHECRSPAAAALLALQELEESTLPQLEARGVRGAVERGEDTLNGALGMMIFPNFSRQPDTSVPRCHSSEESRRVALCSTAAPKYTSGLKELRMNLQLVKQPVESLSGVLDNMLVYLRRQRSGFSQPLGSESERLKLQSAWETAWSNAQANQDISEDALSNADLRMRFQSAHHKTGVSEGIWVGVEQVLRMLGSIHVASTVSHATVMQVMTNYLTNALKYGRGADGKMRIDIDFSLHTSANVNEHLAAESSTPAVRVQTEQRMDALPPSTRSGHLFTALVESRAWISANLRNHERNSGTDSSVGSLLHRFSHTVHNRTDSQQIAAAVQISVTDYGQGLDNDEQGALFQPFSRLRTADDKVPGNGLGLWLMRQLVESQGGTVSAESRGHLHGSCFLLTFPVLLRVGANTRGSVQSGRSAGVLSDSSSPECSPAASPKGSPHLVGSKELRKTRSSIISVAVSAPRMSMHRPKSLASPSPGLCRSSSLAVFQRHSGDPNDAVGEQKAAPTLSMNNLDSLGISPMSDPTSSGLQLLIVDDAQTIRRLLKRQMQRQGFDVDTAEDGEDGFEKWARATESGRPYHCVVTDMTMPRRDGCELTLLIREEEGQRLPGKRTCVIGVTGNVLPEDVRRFKDAGADLVLAKPLNGTALAQHIKSLASKRSPRQVRTCGQ